MEIYDSYYFRINKLLVRSTGLWPYDNKIRNYLLRTYFLVWIFITGGPQFYRIYQVIGINMDRTLENCSNAVYHVMIAVKVISVAAAQDKMKIVYEAAAKNFQTITNAAEREILFKYAEQGRLITLGFIIYIIIGLTSYSMMPATPIFLDLINPLNESRQRYYIWDGEYMIDKEKYYTEVYIFDTLSCIMPVVVLIAVDPMNAVIIEHCLALFAIMRFRLQSIKKNYSKEIPKTESEEEDEKIYKLTVHIIQLHNDILKFAKLLELSYNFYFLLEIFLSIMLISLSAVIILIKHENMFELARYLSISFGASIHVFYLTWPSQKLIDHSTDLFLYTYLNGWYECPIRCQNLLKFMALRCVEPCQLTAGGIYVMNFVNFAAIIKTSVSYITVFSSFR